MPEPIETTSMTALLARPLDLAALTSVPQLQAIAMHAAGVLGEAAFLEGCALLAEDCPVVTHAALRERPPTYHPALHSLVMERCFALMPRGEARDLLAEVEEERTSAAAMIAARAMFQHRPDRFVPGSRPARGVAFLRSSHDLDGWIELADGTVLPWLYAPGGVGRSAVADAARYVAGAIGVERALVVGTHVHAGVVLPPELIFVCTAATPATSHNGSKAA